MANFFKRFLSANVGTNLEAIGSYTVPANNTTTVIGLSVSNTSTNDIDVDITVSNSTSQVFIVKTAPIPKGGALVAIGGDQKVVLEAGDSIKVKSNVSTSVDVVMSVLETTQ